MSKNVIATNDLYEKSIAAGLDFLVNYRKIIFDSTISDEYYNYMFESACSRVKEARKTGKILTPPIDYAFRSSAIMDEFVYASEVVEKAISVANDYYKSGGEM